MELVVQTYELTGRFPLQEKYGLVQQMRRAAVSIPSNIAEGHGRDHLGDYLRMLSIANGSLMELETQFLIATRMNYLRKEQTERALARTAEIARMLSGLSKALKQRYGTRVKPALTPST